jgi:hypothetical protein
MYERETWLDDCGLKAEISKRSKLATRGVRTMVLIGDIVAMNQTLFPGEDATQIVELLRIVDLDISIKDFLPSAGLLKRQNQERHRTVDPSPDGVLTHLTAECKGKLGDVVDVEMASEGSRSEHCYHHSGVMLVSA